MERLAVFQALYNKIGKEVSTKGDSLRARADRYFYDMYEQTGAKSYDVKVLGETVGTYSLRFKKPTQTEIVKELQVTDYTELAEHFDKMDDTYELDMLKKYVGYDLEAYAKWYFDQTGECLPGTDYVGRLVDGKPKQYDGGVLKVDAEKIAEVCERGQLQGVSRLLMGGGDGERD